MLGWYNISIKILKPSFIITAKIKLNSGLILKYYYYKPAHCWCRRYIILTTRYSTSIDASQTFQNMQTCSLTSVSDCEEV